MGVVTRAILSAAFVASFGASAQIVTLSDGNSQAHVNVGSQAGMYNWIVDGQDQLAQQWFWFRVGSTGPERSVDSLGVPTISTIPNLLQTTWTANDFTMRISYLLTGGATGSGVSDISETIRIDNTTSAPLEFHFFQYSDFDLLNTMGADRVELGRNLQGGFDQALVWKGNSVMREWWSDTGVTPGASHGEVGFYGQTLSRLNDGLPTTLNDDAGPIGPGDVTWAFQWDLTIAPGKSAIISKDKSLVVPEPTSISLMVCGLLYLGLRRARR